MVVLTGDDIVQDRNWKPCPGDQCSGCDFKATCPVHTGNPLPAYVPRRMPMDTQLTLLSPEPQLPPRPDLRAVPATAEEQLSLPI
jgi:hypothetical protein